jgi:hypothetical protein
MCQCEPITEENSLNIEETSPLGPQLVISACVSDQKRFRWLEIRFAALAAPMDSILLYKARTLP